jgi:hypothetical protein
MLKKRTPKQKLEFSRYAKTKLYLDNQLTQLMRKLWLFKRQGSSTEMVNMGDHYARAFAEFLDRNRIPKVVSKKSRITTRIALPESAIENLEGIRKIAIKRNQSISLIIEEALTEYLNKPENYLSASERIVERVERIS